MKPIANILVPIDFSDPSRRAMTIAACLGLKYGAKLTVTHVIPEIASNYAFPFDEQELEKKVLMEASKKLPLEIPEAFRGHVDSKVVIKKGDVRNEVLRAVEEERADLIVMGTHGRRYLGRFFLGSTTEELLRRSPIPILTVSDRHTHGTSTSPFDVPFRRILYATDLSVNASAGLHYCLDLARRLGAHMTVLHVMSIHDAETLTSANEIQSILENRLRDWVELEVPKSNASTEVVRGVPHEEILKYANASSADLIVITLQGKGFLERALLGSTAERVVRAAQVPVLSLPLSKPLQSTAEEVRDNAAQ